MARAANYLSGGRLICSARPECPGNVWNCSTYFHRQAVPSSHRQICRHDGVQLVGGVMKTQTQTVMGESNERILLAKTNSRPVCSSLWFPIGMSKSF